MDNKTSFAKSLDYLSTVFILSIIIFSPIMRLVKNYFLAAIFSLGLAFLAQKLINKILARLTKTASLKRAEAQQLKDIINCFASASTTSQDKFWLYAFSKKYNAKLLSPRQIVFFSGSKNLVYYNYYAKAITLAEITALPAGYNSVYLLGKNLNEESANFVAANPKFVFVPPEKCFVLLRYLGVTPKIKYPTTSKAEKLKRLFKNFFSRQNASTFLKIALVCYLFSLSFRLSKIYKIFAIIFALFALFSLLKKEAPAKAKPLFFE